MQVWLHSRSEQKSSSDKEIWRQVYELQDRIVRLDRLREEFCQQQYIRAILMRERDQREEIQLYEESSSEVLTVIEVMDLLKICRSTLYSFIRRGKVTRYKIGGKLRFKRNEILNLLTCSSSLEES